jgi:predicted Zn-dependent protease
MAYNPEKDATVVIGKPYKAALAELKKLKHGMPERAIVQNLIAQACQANGFRVSDFNPKE